MVLLKGRTEREFCYRIIWCTFIKIDLLHNIDKTTIFSKGLAYVFFTEA